MQPIPTPTLSFPEGKGRATRLAKRDALGGVRFKEDTLWLSVDCKFINYFRKRTAKSAAIQLVWPLP